MKVARTNNGRYLPQVFLLLTIATAIGCGTHSSPVVAEPEATVAEKRFDAHWRASRDVLRRYYFTLDRLDRRRGIITTKPLLARHWFEFWRRDAVTAEDIAEGSLQTVYRTAAVKLAPEAEDAQRFHAEVVVTVASSEAQAHVINSMSEAYSLFRLPGDEQEEATGRDEAPAELGATRFDEQLAQRIQRDIAKRAGKLLRKQGL